MPCYPGMNEMASVEEFTSDVELDWNRYCFGMTSQFAYIYDYVHKAPNVLTFEGNEQTSFQASSNQDHSLNYNAVAAYQCRAAGKGGRLQKLKKHLLPALPVPGKLRMPAKLPSFSIPGKSFFSSGLGKRCRTEDVDEISEGPTTKRARGTKDYPVGTGSSTCGGDFEMIGKEETNFMPAANPTNTNTHHYELPLRKSRCGLFGLFQSVEDKSWTVDRRTGHRILTKSD